MPSSRDVAQGARLRVVLYFLVFTFLWATRARAENVLLTDESVRQVLKSARPLGILYACEPYCEFISLNEGAGWNPHLNNQRVDSAHLKFIRPEDPEYPLLVTSTPVLPFAQAKAQKAGKDGVGMTAYERQVRDSGGSWLIGYGAGLKMIKSQVSSDTAVLSQSTSNRPLQAFTLEFGIRPLWLPTVFSHPIRLAMDVSMFSSQKAPDTGNIGTTGMTGQNLALESRLFTDWTEWIAELDEETQKTTGSARVESYDVSTSSILVKAGAGGGRWRVVGLTSLASSVSDDLGYRAPPFERSLVGLEVRYCVPRFKKHGFDFSPCLDLGWSQETQTGQINSALISGASGSSVRYQRISLGLVLQFGDLLWE